MNELDQLFEVNIWKFIEAVIIQYIIQFSDVITKEKHM